MATSTTRHSGTKKLAVRRPQRRSVIASVASIIFFPATIVIYFRSRRLSLFGEDIQLSVLGHKSPTIFSKAEKAALYNTTGIQPLSDGERSMLGLPPIMTNVANGSGLHPTNPGNILGLNLMRDDHTDDVIRQIKGLDIYDICTRFLASHDN